MHATKQAMMRDVMAADCRGPGADCTGPARAYNIVSEMCYMGFLSPVTHADFVTQMGCPAAADPSHVDFHKNLSAFLDSYQLQMPTPCILGDGQPYFAPTLPSGVTCAAGSTPNPQYDPDITKNEYAWVAAFLLCQQMRGMPKPTVAVVNRSVTSADIAALYQQEMMDTADLSAADTCFDALIKRTAVKTDILAQAFGGGAQTLAQSQNALCQFMGTDPNATYTDSAGKQGGQPVFPTQVGMGWGDNPDVQACMNGQVGMSYWNANNIEATKCQGTKWISMYMPNTAPGSHEAEGVARDKCPQWKNEFDGRFAEDNASVKAGIENAAALIQDEYYFLEQHNTASSARGRQGNQ